MKFQKTCFSFILQGLIKIFQEVKEKVKKEKEKIKIRMDILFQATGFRLNNNKQAVVEIPFDSKDRKFTVDAMLNPKPSKTWLKISGEEHLLQTGKCNESI